MKILWIITAASCCLVLTFAVNAKTDVSNEDAGGSAELNGQSGFDYCDHWPESCNEICENGSSPWGPYQICRLSPPWDPISASDNPYNYVGQAHNLALERVADNASFVDLDKKLATTHMIQLSAEYLCKNGVPKSQTSIRNIRFGKTLNSFVASDNHCTFLYAGLSNQVMNELRHVIYSDGPVNELVDGYVEAIKLKGKLGDEQLSAIKNLYQLLPADDNIDDLPYLFDRIAEFDKYVSSEMNREDAEVVLLGSAVMRASLEHWFQQIKEPSDWFAIESGNTERRGIFRKILKLIAADAGGCLGGTIIAGVPGCVIGAVGASAGAGAAMD